MHEIEPLETFEKMLEPEDVCLLERASSADYRLISLGIEQGMDVPKIEQALARMNGLKDFMKSRLKATKEMAHNYRGTAKEKGLLKLVDILDVSYSHLKKEIAVGR